MTVIARDDKNKKENNKIHFSKRVGNDCHIFGKNYDLIIQDYFKGKRRKDEKLIENHHERIGNDLFQYRNGHTFIIIDFYAYYKKDILKGKKLRLANLDKDKAPCVILLIMCIVIPLIFPLFNFASPTIKFYVEGNKKEFRAGNTISFGWDISFTPSQVFIIWGDGTIYDNKNASSGSTEHIYDLQGRYTPSLLVWNSAGKLRSKPIEIKIENNMLQFNIEVIDSACEGQDVLISVDNIFALNKELSKEEKGLNFVYDLSETRVISNESTITYKWKNAGTFPLTVSVIDSQGVISRKCRFISIRNQPPEASFTISGDGPHYARTDIKFTADLSTDTINDNNSLQYLWNWGDNTASWGKYVSHSYYNHGSYLVSLTVIDDDGVSDTYSQVVAISPPISSNLPIYNSTCSGPYIAIGPFIDKVYEDEIVQFTAEVNQNITDFRVLWSFGDGTYSYERAPTHAWSNVGSYIVKLEVIDSEDQCYVRTKPITIKEKAPEIAGPYNFQGIEGQALVLDVEVYDSIIDTPYLEYTWYNQHNMVFSNEKKPTLILGKGTYTYRLEVSDPSGMVSSHEISVIIHPISHELFIPNYMYHGTPGKELTVRAYLHDTAMNNSEYTYYWNIKQGNTILKTSQRCSTHYHQISFICTTTTIYQGQVKVVDSSGNAKVSTFQIYSIIDSSHDGVNDEYEDMLQLYTASPYEADEDSDNDHLPDNYERTVSNTSCFASDTDDDGLYDGYDDTGVGELTIGTDPLKYDTDGDLLKDSIEYYGWEISINYFENRTSFQVNSDPLLQDTDLDGLSDYEEYHLRTNPNLADSDSDKLLDGDDPFPTTWDQDNDLLSDFMEFKLGTDINVSDSDL
ncbi:MAG: PKD domain-containing protein, partial [Candidatus Hermodarchaeota archaeon]